MATEDQVHSQEERAYALAHPYAAQVAVDPIIGSTALELFYRDQIHPAHSISVSIAPDLGSNMFRLHVGAYDLLYCDQELLKRKGFTGNFVLWPFPNRIRDKHYSYQGKSYSLDTIDRKEHPMLVHGLVFDQPWQYKQPVIGPDSVSVTTYIDITPESPCYTVYPFESRLELTYTLTNSLIRTTYCVQNNGSKELPFGFALHPYFSLLSGPQETLISLPADEVMEADDMLLPTGRIFALDKIMYAMYDLRNPVAVGNLKLDHVYTGVHKQESAVIEYRQQAMQLQISTTEDFSHIVIYTPPDVPFFCVEHQTCSTDAINLYNQGLERRKMAHLLEVHPGATYSGSLDYKLVFLDQ